MEEEGDRARTYEGPQGDPKSGPLEKLWDGEVGKVEQFFSISIFFKK